VAIPAPTEIASADFASLAMTENGKAKFLLFDLSFLSFIFYF